MNNNLMWGYLAHLGYNMWADMDSTDILEGTGSYDIATDYLQFERETWNKVVDRLAKGGCNTIILDIGEGIVLESHPEIAIKGSWTKKRTPRRRRAACSISSGWASANAHPKRRSSIWSRETTSCSKTRSA